MMIQKTTLLVEDEVHRKIQRHKIKLKTNKQTKYRIMDIFWIIKEDALTNIIWKIKEGKKEFQSQPVIGHFFLLIIKNNTDGQGRKHVGFD